MNKKFIFSLIILLILTVISLSACDEGEVGCAHVYELTYTKSANCTEKGYSRYRCSLCADTYDDNIVEAKGHTEVTDPGVEATCTAEGLTEGKHCTVCETVTVPQESVPMLEHE